MRETDAAAADEISERAKGAARSSLHNASPEDGEEISFCSPNVLASFPAASLAFPCIHPFLEAERQKPSRIVIVVNDVKCASLSIKPSLGPLPV